MGKIHFHLEVTKYRLLCLMITNIECLQDFEGRIKLTSRLCYIYKAVCGFVEDVKVQKHGKISGESFCLSS